MADRKFKPSTIIAYLTIASLTIGIIGTIRGWWQSDEKAEVNLNRINSDNNTYIYNNTLDQNKKKGLPIKKKGFSSEEQLGNKKNSASENTKNTMAILPFENSSNLENYSWLSKGISETLIESFNNSNITLVEGSQRDKILKEIDFQQGKYVNVKTAVEIGKMLGANKVLIGSYQIEAKKIYLTARVIDVKLGTVVKNSIVTHTDSVNDIFSVQQQFVQLIKKSIPND